MLKQASSGRRPTVILRALSEGQVPAPPKFIGAKEYEAAGGLMVRDLFDAEGGGFFADAELLNRLAREKLQPQADKVASEGWEWVVAEPDGGQRRLAVGPRLALARV